MRENILFIGQNVDTKNLKISHEKYYTQKIKTCQHSLINRMRALKHATSSIFRFLIATLEYQNNCITAIVEYFLMCCNQCSQILIAISCDGRIMVIAMLQQSNIFQCASTNIPRFFITKLQYQNNCNLAIVEYFEYVATSITRFLITILQHQHNCNAVIVEYFQINQN